MIKMPRLEITTSILEKGCTVACKICPQPLLASEYKGAVRYMRLDDFVKILSTVPKNYRIVFSGYAEPFLNADCLKMILHACSEGYPTHCFTTLVGVGVGLLTIGELSRLPLDSLEVHLPDKNGTMPITVSKKYRMILSRLLELGGPNVRYMTMGREVHPDIKDLMGSQVLVSGNFEPVSRASNLDNVPSVERISGPIRCTPMPNQNHNVVLPNGDVQLCCNDYGLRHRFGNLLTGSHADLFTSDEFVSLRAAMKNDQGENILCRTCEMACSE